MDDKIIDMWMWRDDVCGLAACYRQTCGS